MKASIFKLVKIKHVGWGRNCIFCRTYYYRNLLFYRYPSKWGG